MKINKSSLHYLLTRTKLVGQSETNVRKSYVKSDFPTEKVDRLIEIFKGI